MNTVYLEGPFESDYSLAIVNRRLARASLDSGLSLRLHQRDNTISYFPKTAFLSEWPDLAPLFISGPPEPAADIHSRYIHPPYVDGFAGRLRAVHCYGWEESHFPKQYAENFNKLDLVTVMSDFVRQVLEAGGVRVPIVAVGLGADHILEVPAIEPEGIRSDAFTFLHVSSCFPRKGADALVRAFCEEFTRRDEVRLLIKTFANPHNEIDRIVNETSQLYPSHAPIQVVQHSLNLAEMRWLYEHAGCLVSPSRGEGFGLSVAEAMLAGCPVVATAYSGQAETCSEDTAWPVEFRLEQARTHLTESVSLWAEPAPASLRRQMRGLYCASDAERRPRTDSARRLIAERFSWRSVARRHWRACAEELERKQAKPAHHYVEAAYPAPAEACMRIGFVSSWNTRCGIAEYTRHLAAALPTGCTSLVFATRERPVRPDEEFVSRCWEPDRGADGGETTELIRAIVAAGVDAVSIQFNFGMFSPGRLEALVRGLKRAGIPAAVTLHATKFDKVARMRSALSKSALCICHRREDVVRLQEIGVGANVTLMRQGIPAPAVDRRIARTVVRRGSQSFVVSCFGFFLPAKGIHQLVEALALTRRVEPLIELNLLTALYPNQESEDYARRCLALIENHGLGHSVSVNTEFLEEDRIHLELAASDLVVLPYCYSSESSSAAVRLPIASGTPILCSDIEIFDEFAPCLHRFPAGNAVALANAVLRLAANPEELSRFTPWQRKVVEDWSWQNVAREFVCRLAAITRRKK